MIRSLWMSACRLRVISCSNAESARSTLGIVRGIAYELPDELVALHPADPRDSSRLLCILPKNEANVRNHQRRSILVNHIKTVYRDFDACPTKLGDFKFRDLTKLLPTEGCHLVMNSSKVLSARLQVRSKSNHSPCELLLLSPADDSDPNNLMQQPAAGQVWRCMIRSSELGAGDGLRLLNSDTTGDVEIKEDRNGEHDMVYIRNVHGLWIEDGEEDGIEADVEFSVLNETDGRITMDDVLSKFGAVPIPPYLNRDPVSTDNETYQTIYAKKQGSVAAPTAGLHFSDSMMSKIKSNGSNHIVSEVTLHVGAGTFKPVDAGIESHNMHRESFEVTEEALEALIKSISISVPVVSVGTTSVRVLESLFWLGARNMLAKNSSTTSSQVSDRALALGQWEPDDIIDAYGALNVRLPLPEHALSALRHNLHKDETSCSLCLTGTTEICIAKDYRFQLTDGLVTNFHQSKSTLMYLTSALLGGETRLLEAYDHAIRQQYRFLSYGDACLMIVNT